MEENSIVQTTEKKKNCYRCVGVKGRSKRIEIHHFHLDAFRVLQEILHRKAQQTLFKIPESMQKNNYYKNSQK